MVHTNLINHLELNKLLYEHQYGFLRGRSTEQNLLQVVNYISNSLNSGNFCIGIFLDLKKAFDVCSHPILLKKLKKLGVEGTALDWFTSYLSNRKQKVDINGHFSGEKLINISVLQGSILGPTLFLCYTVLMTYFLSQTWQHFYLLTTRHAWPKIKICRISSDLLM